MADLILRDVPTGLLADLQAWSKRHNVSPEEAAAGLIRLGLELSSDTMEEAADKLDAIIAGRRTREPQDCPKCDGGWVCENHPDLPHEHPSLTNSDLACGGGRIPCDCAIGQALGTELNQQYRPDSDRKD
jgi:hypothetical protein